MTTITVTPEMLKQLNGLVGPLEFRDTKGRLLGAFQPSGVELTYDQMLATCPHTEAELKEISRQARELGSGRALSEILRDLEAKWPSK